MANNKIIIFIFLSISIFSQDKISNLDINLVKEKSASLYSNNPASLSVLEDVKCTDLNFTYDYYKKEYFKFWQAEKTNDYSLNITSYTNINNKVFFYGKMQYINQNEINKANNYYPDIIFNEALFSGDSINRDYNNEFYVIQGGLSVPLFNKKLVLGALANYNVMKGSSQKDPRPLSTIMDLVFRLGYIYNVNNKIGFGQNIIIKNKTHDFELIIENDKTSSSYFYRGFGFYSIESYTSSLDDRLQKLSKYGIDAQLFLNNENIENIVELSYLSGKEAMTEGVSLKNFADIFSQEISAKIITKIKYKSFSHFIDLKYSNIIENEGEYIIRKKQINIEGILYNINVIYANFKNNEHISNKLDLKYSLLKNTNNRMDWFLNLNVSYLKDEFNCFIIPEVFNKEFSNINSTLSFNMPLYFNKIDFYWGINISYLYNIDKTLLYDKKIFSSDFNSKTELIEKVFEYDTMTKLGYGVNAKFIYKLNLENINSVFINLKFNHVQFENDKNQLFLSSSIGLNF